MASVGASLTYSAENAELMLLLRRIRRKDSFGIAINVAFPVFE